MLNPNKYSKFIRFELIPNNLTDNVLNKRLFSCPFGLRRPQPLATTRRREWCLFFVVWRLLSFQETFGKRKVLTVQSNFLKPFCNFFSYDVWTVFLKIVLAFSNIDHLRIREAIPDIFDPLFCNNCSWMSVQTQFWNI